jgi:hypothetical protein
MSEAALVQALLLFAASFMVGMTLSRMMKK